MNWKPGAVFAVRAFAFGVVFLCLFDKRGFDLAAGQNRQGIRVQTVEEVFVRAVGLRVGEEVFVQTNLGINGSLAVNPVNGCALDLAAVGRVAAAGIGVIRRVNFLDAAVGGLLAARCQVMRYAPFRRHSGPLGYRRLYLGMGSGRKSSASIQTSRENVTVCVPCSGWTGLFSTSNVSVWPSG